MSGIRSLDQANIDRAVAKVKETFANKEIEKIVIELYNKLLERQIIQIDTTTHFCDKNKYPISIDIPAYWMSDNNNCYRRDWLGGYHAESVGGYISREYNLRSWYYKIPRTGKTSDAFFFELGKCLWNNGSDKHKCEFKNYLYRTGPYEAKLSFCTQHTTLMEMTKQCWEIENPPDVLPNFKNCSSDDDFYKRHQKQILLNYNAKSLIVTKLKSEERRKKQQELAWKNRSWLCKLLNKNK